jgi:hypothetical protein
MKTGETYTGVLSIEFYRRFQSDADCNKYLSEIKWKNGYVRLQAIKKGESVILIYL